LFNFVGALRGDLCDSTAFLFLKVEKNQAEWRRRRQQWSQHGRHVASVREDCPADRSSPPPHVPARLNRSVDVDLRAPCTAAATATSAVPVGVRDAVQPTTTTTASRSFLGRASALSCRVLLLDGEQITVDIEVKRQRLCQK